MIVTINLASTWLLLFGNIYTDLKKSIQSVLLGSISKDCKRMMKLFQCFFCCSVSLLFLQARRWEPLFFLQQLNSHLVSTEGACASVIHGEEWKLCKVKKLTSRLMCHKLVLTDCNVQSIKSQTTVGLSEILLEKKKKRQNIWEGVVISQRQDKL